MKYLTFLFLVAAPLLVLATTSSTTEDATPLAAALNGTVPVPVVMSTNKASPAPESVTSSAEHDPQTDASTSKDNGVFQQPAPATTKLDGSSLHRVPVYEDRHLPVETISKLESLGEKITSQLKKRLEEVKATTAPTLELPIPSRCPAITGTENVGNDMIPLLGADSSARAAQRGCRFFIMTELMDRSSADYLHATTAEQISRTLTACFTCKLILYF